MLVEEDHASHGDRAIGAGRKVSALRELSPGRGRPLPTGGARRVSEIIRQPEGERDLLWQAWFVANEPVQHTPLGRHVVVTRQAVVIGDRLWW
jgi:hypothetical protein